MLRRLQLLPTLFVTKTTSKQFEWHKSINLNSQCIPQISFIFEIDQKFEQSYRHTEDERVVLPCPVPTALHANVTWYKDGILLDNDRVAFEDFETKRNSRLVFSQVKKEDHGVYVCVATMTVATKSYTTRLRVIGKTFFFFWRH